MFSVPPIGDDPSDDGGKENNEGASFGNIAPRRHVFHRGRRLIPLWLEGSARPTCGYRRKAKFQVREPEQVVR